MAKSKYLDNIVEGTKYGEIQTGIPIPPAEQKKNGQYEKWPMSQMEVGDSFMAKGRVNPGGFYGRATKLGIKITVRKMGRAGYRVWRIE